MQRGIIYVAFFHFFLFKKRHIFYSIKGFNAFFIESECMCIGWCQLKCNSEPHNDSPLCRHSTQTCFFHFSYKLGHSLPCGRYDKHWCEFTACRQMGLQTVYLDQKPKCPSVIRNNHSWEKKVQDEDEKTGFKKEQDQHLQSCKTHAHLRW